MNKKTIVAYPSGNTTAIIREDLGDFDRKELNTKILNFWKSNFPEKPEIEQCGFITKPKDSKSIARLEMFGGEFCANAGRSVIKILTNGKDDEGFVEISGSSKPLKYKVKENEISLQMPIPESGLIQEIEEGKIIKLEGIWQIVILDETLKSKYTAREIMQKFLSENKYDIKNEPCVGVSFYDEETNKADFCVWINKVDTIFDETACGSGTCAISIALADKYKKNMNLDIIQPSGEIIKAQTLYVDNKVVESLIAGEVDILYEGELNLINGK